MRPGWHERLGWLLLLAGWTWAIGLDPWSLGERRPINLFASTRLEARHAQAVVLAMGFLLLAVCLLLGRPGRPVERWVSWLFLVGTLLYVAGYVELLLPGRWAWLIPLGAGLNLLAFAVLAWASFRRPDSLHRRVVLCVFCLGMVLDLVTGLGAVAPEHSLSRMIGPVDGVGQRMLRLARVAATALSLLVLLFQRWSAPEGSSSLVRLGRLGLVLGCAGMPTILAAASFVNEGIKFLLPIPALSTTIGVACAFLLSRRTAKPLECWGWLLIAVSMSIGLLIGTYAFDGPLDPARMLNPLPTQKEYNGFYRRLTRLEHAYTIVLGMLAILMARTSKGRLPGALLLAGTCATLLAIPAQTLWPLLWPLRVGPALVALALLVAWVRRTPLSPAPSVTDRGVGVPEQEGESKNQGNSPPGVTP